MIRKIVHIDEEKCNGCGACANTCHEGAIAMVNGKARLIRDDYCDGLGDCLPACPTGAITVKEREAAAYDEEAVAKHMEARKQEQKTAAHAGGCPGSRIHQFNLNGGNQGAEASSSDVPSQLRQWPVQIKLNRRPDGSSLLRRHRSGGEECPARKRKIHSVAGRHPVYRRKDTRLSFPCALSAPS